MSRGGCCDLGEKGVLAGIFALFGFARTFFGDFFRVHDVGDWVIDVHVLLLSCAGRSHLGPDTNDAIFLTRLVTSDTVLKENRILGPGRSHLAHIALGQLFDFAYISCMN